MSVTTIRQRLVDADRYTLAFLLAAIVVAVVLLVVGRGITFVADEWAFINERQAWDLNTFLRPHNEHWSAVPILIYKILLATVGLRTYLPYHVVVVALHLVTAGALLQLLRREAGPLLALCGAGLFLVFGYGGENLLWPALIGWNAAMAAGGWALVLALEDCRRTRQIAIAVLLVIAVASSGVGLFFLAVVALALLLTAERRRQLWVVLPATVIYGAWYLAIGRTAVATGLLDPARLRDVPDYVFLGIGNAFGRVVGWGPEPGKMLAIVVLVATLWRLLGARQFLLGAALGFVGLFVQFGLTGLSRVQFGVDQAASARYVYTAAFFILLILGSWLATLRISTSRPRSIAVLGVLMAVAVGANLYGLLGLRTYLLNLSNDSRAAMILITRYGGSPGLPATTGWLSIPNRNQLEQLTGAFGSPLRDALQPAPDPPNTSFDSVLFDMVGNQVNIASSPLPTDTLVPKVGDAVDVSTTDLDGCSIVQPTGAQPHVTATVPSGSSLFVVSAGAGSAKASISMFGAFSDKGVRQISVAPETPVRISLPDLGTGTTWLVRFEPPPLVETRLCLAQGT